MPAKAGTPYVLPTLARCVNYALIHLLMKYAITSQANGATSPGEAEGFGLGIPANGGRWTEAPACAAHRAATSRPRSQTQWAIAGESAARLSVAVVPGKQV